VIDKEEKHVLSASQNKLFKSASWSSLLDKVDDTFAFLNEDLPLWLLYELL
jgi:hypothetical protein